MTSPIGKPINPALAALGFGPIGPKNPKRRRLCISSEGAPATGKTDFIRRMPPPQVIIDFDRGAEGVAERDVWGNPIGVIALEMPDLDLFGKNASPGERQMAGQTYARFKQLVESTIRSEAAASIMIDTGTAAYALAQIARFGQIAQVGEVPAAMWTSMQAEYMGIFDLAYSYSCNLYIAHQQGLKFQGVAGETELKGLKKIKYWAQVHLDFQKRPVHAPTSSGMGVGKIVDQEFVRVVKKCRQRIAVEGTEFPVIFLDDDKQQSVGGDFLTIAQTIFPMSNENEWFT